MPKVISARKYKKKKNEMIPLKVNNRLLLKCLNVAVSKEVSWQLH